MALLGLSGAGGLRLAGLSLGCFALWNALVVPVTRCAAPGLAARLEAHGRRAEWVNYVVSLSYIVLVSTAVVAIAAREGLTFLSDGLVARESDSCRGVLVLSLGYFAFDSIDMVRGGSLDWQMALHHGVMLSVYSSSIYYDIYQVYTTTGLICETNTIFLHLRKLLQLAEVDRESRLYRANLGLLLLGFFPQRVCPHLYLLGRVWRDRDLFAARWMWALAFLGLAAINGLNALLLRSVLHADRRLLRRLAGLAQEADRQPQSKAQ
jgi:hypothetical protein